MKEKYEEIMKAKSLANGRSSQTPTTKGDSKQRERLVKREKCGYNNFTIVGSQSKDKSMRQRYEEMRKLKNSARGRSSMTPTAREDGKQLMVINKMKKQVSNCTVVGSQSKDEIRESMRRRYKEMLELKKSANGRSSQSPTARENSRN